MARDPADRELTARQAKARQPATAGAALEQAPKARAGQDPVEVRISAARLPKANSSAPEWMLAALQEARARTFRALKLRSIFRERQTVRSKQAPAGRVLAPELDLDAARGLEQGRERGWALELGRAREREWAPVRGRAEAVAARLPKTKSSGFSAR